MVGENQLKLHV